MTPPASQPWWASDGPVDGAVDPGEDPLDAHRRARASGGRDDHGPGPAWHDVLAGAATALDRLAVAMTEVAGGAAAADGTDGHGSVDACGVCPLCAAMRATAETRPELLDHLAEASRHVAAAVRTLADPTGPSTGWDEEPLERIDLDRSPGRD